MKPNWRNAGGFGAAVCIATFASFLVPSPPDMVPVFTVSAIGSGAVGYWISWARDFGGMNGLTRAIIGVIVLLILVLSGYGYMTYYHLSTPSVVQDILGVSAFGLMFATVCFVLGLVQIHILPPGPHSQAQ